MRSRLQYVIFLILILSLPFVIGTNITTNLSLNGTEQKVLGLGDILSNGSTTDFDEFLDKEYGVYYELIDDPNLSEPTFEKLLDKRNLTSNTSDVFSNTTDVIVIEDELSDFDSVYISIDEISSDQGRGDNAIFDLDDEQVLARLTEGDIELTFGKLNQAPLVEGSSVKWNQTFIVTNNGLAQTEFTLNLWSYDSILDRSFLWDVLKVSVLLDGEQISQTPIGLVSLQAGEVKAIVVEYETPAVIVHKRCFDVTVADLIPSDATIIESSIDLDVVVESVCTGSIEYPSGIRYKQVSFE